MVNAFIMSKILFASYAQALWAPGSCCTLATFGDSYNSLDPTDHMLQFGMPRNQLARLIMLSETISKNVHLQKESSEHRGGNNIIMSYVPSNHYPGNLVPMFVK